MTVAVFQGASALTLDGKGRVTIPIRHRDVLLSTAQGKLTLTKHPVGCLLVFPRPTWEQLREMLSKTTGDFEPIRRIFIGSAMDVEIDGGSRVLVSPELRAAAGLTRDVMLLGMGSRLELWDAERYKAHEAAVMAAGMPDAIKNLVF